MTISNDDKIDLNQIISEFVQYINEDSPNLSTDPNAIKIKVIKADENDCPSCSRTRIIRQDSC